MQTSHESPASLGGGRFKDKITIIVPCYNEQEVIDLFYPAVQAHVMKIPDCEFNYIFVNDGSRDATLEKLRELSAAHDDVTYLSLSRNFGKESAMMAGIDFADGDAPARKNFRDDKVLARGLRRCLRQACRPRRRDLA